MKYYFYLISLLFSLSTMASPFCERTNEDIRELLEDSSSRISFKNRGGLINGGVCWWHSRMQRSSVYLVKFDPARNKPTSAHALEILWSLRNMNKIVTIPGYTDFATFSADFKNEMQSVLEAWQKFDGFYNFQWIRGISGKHSLPAKSMEARMNAVYNSYASSPAPLWIMAQIKGITSHSYLVHRMEKLASGYMLFLIDSNHPTKLLEVRYQFGDTFLKSRESSSTFVPYVGFQEDFRLIGQTMKAHCQSKSPNIADLLNAKPGDVELPRR